MVKQCAIKNCKKEWQPNTNVSYHGFPMKNEILLAKWMEAIPPDLMNKPTKYSCICSIHFSPKSFEINPTHRLINRLKKDAVPSIFDNYDKSTVFIKNYLMDMLISSEDSNPETTPERNRDEEIADVLDTNNVRMNFEIIKHDRSKRNVGVQTSSKQFKSKKERELKKQVGLLQKRLEHRDMRIKSLMKLIDQLKKHVAVIQKSKLKLNEVS